MRHLLLQIACIAIIVATFFILLPLLEQPLGAEQSKYTGNENHKISLEEAAGLTKAFRISDPSAAVLGHYFGKKALEEALAQPGCVGARIYYGKHKDGSAALVVVGVDGSGNDMTAGITLQRTWACPPLCPENSILLHDNTMANLK